MLRYVDGEGDLVTITSRPDLQAAFAEALKVWWVYVNWTVCSGSYI